MKRRSFFFRRRINTSRPEILHIITGLGVGGAEMMLFRLLAHSQKVGTPTAVLSLTELGHVGKKIERLKVPVFSLELKPGQIPGPLTLFRLLNIVYQLRPRVIQGWMYHGNITGSLVKMLLTGKTRLYWNIRQTLNTLDEEKWLTARMIMLNSKLSRFADKVVFNSELSAKQHRELGFSDNNMLVIPNGFDLSEYAPNSNHYRSLRNEIGIPENSVLVGHIARFHPKKDHELLFRAMCKVFPNCPEVHLLIVGRDTDQLVSKFSTAEIGASISNRVHVLGERTDTRRIFPALDVVVSSSAWGEGFPNVIGEAMSCGVSCVVTDVGESARLVGETGLVVRPQDQEALANAIINRLSLPPSERKRLGHLCRKRIKDYYSIDRIAKEYQALYRID